MTTCALTSVELICASQTRLSALSPIHLTSRLATMLLHKGTAWEVKLRQLQTGGANSLQIVLDWDRTCTVSGAPTSHGMLEALAPLSARLELKRMLDHYHPIEMDTTLTIAQRQPLMLEWYAKAHGLLVESELRRSSLRASCAAAVAGVGPSAVMRRELGALLDKAADAGVPVLIFSAGVADVIEELLRAWLAPRPLPPTLAVVGNRAHWAPTAAGDDEVLAGFDGELITMFNKGESALHGTHLYEALCARPYVLLCGDSLGDARMADGLPHAAVLRLGLLNAADASPHLPAYAETFDAVYASQDSFAPLLDALTAIIGDGAGSDACDGAAVSAAAQSQSQQDLLAAIDELR